MMFLSVFLIFALSIFDGRASYFGVALFLLVGVVQVCFFSSTISARKLNSQQFFVFILPLFIFFSWCYGVVIGLLNGVNVSYVFTNFAGLALYVIFYLFYFSVGIKVSKKALFFSAICSAGFAFYSVYSAFAVVGGGGDSSGIGLADLRTLYSSAFLYVVPFLFICLVSLFLQTDNKFGFSGYVRAFFWLAVFSFTLIVPAMSKGFILVFLIMFMFIFLAGYSSALRHLAIGRNLFIMTLVVIAVSIALLLFTNLYEVILFSFSSGEGSNSVRSEQFDYLVSEWNFTGAGLGSSLDSGYKRDETGYGFELTYVNLVNKLGVFSLPLFLSYASTIFYGLKFFFLDGKRVSGAWVLGSMAFLIPGAGNPLLLAPVFVFMHFLAIMLIITELCPDGNTDEGNETESGAVGS
ncbi:hypothetical protein H7698_03400 [Pseudomonas sp. p50]|uniref:hypothetical protein n=1 Tax=Pseudomonas sp. p50(2008) TaxID=2816832 RepID=UPI00188D7112|nr:hypothetical protein [Pseudomonas sp. p50(2008)]MBF4555103.1 hypothetical protein [Pseudomonas sp. p50(2008)]